MSLINDALKRAKQAHEQKTPPEFRGAPLHTVPTPPRKSSAPVIIVGISILLALLLVVAVIMLLVRPNGSRTQPAAIATPAQPARPAPVAAVTTPAPPAAPEPVKPPEPMVTASPEPAPPVAAPEAPVLHLMPLVKLQGVLYSPTRPAAIINGRSLFVGDHIGDVHVIAIHQQSATVTWNGQTNELTMEQR